MKSAPSFVSAVFLALISGAALSESVELPGFGYVGGFIGPEDLVPIPDSQWIIAGDLGQGGKLGGLYLIDRLSRQASKMFPGERMRYRFNEESYPTCPGLPDPDSFSAHGINLATDPSGGSHLYVVNHGDREAIEVFRVESEGATPELTWVGCIPLPKGAMANAVAPIPGQGVVATHFIAPQYFEDQYFENQKLESQDPMTDSSLWISRLMTGEPTGYGAVWTSDSGWTAIPGTEGSGPNGIEVSPDGEWVWVALWGNKQLVKASLVDRRTRKTIDLDFMPDNLRWGDDGHLWVAGASGKPTDYFACVAATDCHGDFVVAAVNIQSHEVIQMPVPEHLDDFGDATTAFVLEGEVWVGANPSDKVLYYRLSDEGSAP